MTPTLKLYRVRLACSGCCCCHVGAMVPALAAPDPSLAMALPTRQRPHPPPPPAKPSFT
jgi:hypothetical protein